MGGGVSVNFFLEVTKVITAGGRKISRETFAQLYSAAKARIITIVQCLVKHRYDAKGKCQMAPVCFARISGLIESGHDFSRSHPIAVFIKNGYTSDQKDNYSGI